MNLPHKYVAIDIETTDADYEKGDIIQLAAVVINENFSIGEKFMTYIHPRSEWRNPEAQAVHQISEDTLITAPFIERALEDFEEFALKVERRPVLAAWGAYFDVPFLEHSYKKINRHYPFSYKSFDLKAVAIWESSKRDMQAGGGVAAFLERAGLQFEGKPHDAMADILNSVRVVQSFL